LLVLRVFGTNDVTHALALTVATNHEAAVFTDRFAGRADFHALVGAAGVAAGAAGLLGEKR
jgi:hypothetical protein